MRPANRLGRYLRYSETLTGGILLARCSSVWCDDQATPRHPGEPTGSCFLPDLTRLAGSRCVEPDRRAERSCGGRHASGPGPPAPIGSTRICPTLPGGGMRERPNRHAWKACEGQPSVGSNPTSSATDLAFLRRRRVGDAPVVSVRGRVTLSEHHLRISSEPRRLPSSLPVLWCEYRNSATGPPIARSV